MPTRIHFTATYKGEERRLVLSPLTIYNQEQRNNFFLHDFEGTLIGRFYREGKEWKLDSPGGYMGEPGMIEQYVEALIRWYG